MKSGLAFTPENYISQKFANNLRQYGKMTNGKFITYTHTGLDTTGSTSVVSPGFLEGIVPKKGKANHAAILAFRGSDVRFRGLHLNPDQVARINNGTLLIPGQLIGNTGDYGNSGGIHFHLDATRTNSAGTRGFVNPLTLGGWRPGSDFGGFLEELDSEGEYVKTNKWPVSNAF